MGFKLDWFYKLDTWNEYIRIYPATLKQVSKGGTPPSTTPRGSPSTRCFWSQANFARKENTSHTRFFQRNKLVRGKPVVSRMSLSLLSLRPFLAIISPNYFQITVNNVYFCGISIDCWIGFTLTVVICLVSLSIGWPQHLIMVRFIICIFFQAENPLNNFKTASWGLLKCFICAHTQSFSTVLP